MSNPYAPPDPASRRAGTHAHKPDDDATHHGAAGAGRGAGQGGDGSAGSGSAGDGSAGAGSSGAGSAPNSQKPQKSQKQQRPEPTPEQLAATSRSVLYFGLLMLGAVLLMQVDLPWQLAAILFAVAAVVVGVRTMVRVLRQGQRGGIAALLIFGLVLSGMLVVATTTSLALWNEQMERQQCLNSAITLTAQEQCEQAYQEAIEDRFELIPGDF